MATKKNVLTREGYEKLQKELHVLKTETLPEIVLQIKDAKAEWDLSENSEYHAAKEKQVLTVKRISDIETMLKDVEILEEDKSGKSSKNVRYGSKVTIQYESGKEYMFTVVPSAEVSLSEDALAISFESPVGKAIEGKSEGEVVQVRLPEGRQNVTITSVK